MRVLVTGNLGYIGTVLTPILQARGHTIRGLDVDFYRACSFPPDVELPPVTTVHKDIRDVSEADLEGFDAVIHLAGLANEPLGEINPDLTSAINHRATVRLAECARAAGVGRFLFASSCSIYGKSGEALVDEESPPRPLTAYAHSKLASEKDLAALETADFRVVSFRCGTVYGASPRPRFDLVVNNLVAWAHATGQILLKSDGSSWRPLAHVEDVARIYAEFLEASDPLFDGGIFNVGFSSDNVIIRDLADIIAAAVPGSRVAFAEGAERDPRSYRVDFSKLAKAVPTFRPDWTIEAGAREVAQQLAAHPISAAEFEGTAYQRRAHLLALMQAGELDQELRRKPPMDVVSQASSVRSDVG